MLLFLVFHPKICPAFSGKKTRRKALLTIKKNEQTHPGICLLCELECLKCFEASFWIWQRGGLWAHEWVFPLLWQDAVLSHIMCMQQWLQSFCWTSRFSVHWNAKPVLSLTADQPADKQSKSGWICCALIKDRRKNRSGAVKQVGGKAGKSVPKKVWHILHPLERNTWLLSARILLCSAARGGSLTLPHSFGMFLLGSLEK